MGGSGATATLDEAGYEDVVSMKQNGPMEAFIRRVLQAHGATVEKEDSLRGMVPYYSGEKASQSFEQLVAELAGAKWVLNFDKRTESILEVKASSKSKLGL